MFGTYVYRTQGLENGSKRTYLVKNKLSRIIPKTSQMKESTPSIDNFESQKNKRRRKKTGKI
jgi:hypothetical protein